jgi:hypothetical protein
MLYLVIMVIPLLSCQNEARWYPDAEVEISNRMEYGDPAAGLKPSKILGITYGHQVDLSKDN